MAEKKSRRAKVDELSSLFHRGVLLLFKQLTIVDLELVKLDEDLIKFKRFSLEDLEHWSIRLKPPLEGGESSSLRV